MITHLLANRGASTVALMLHTNVRVWVWVWVWIWVLITWALRKTQKPKQHWQEGVLNCCGCSDDVWRSTFDVRRLSLTVVNRRCVNSLISSNTRYKIQDTMLTLLYELREFSVGFEYATTAVNSAFTVVQRRLHNFPSLPLSPYRSLSPTPCYRVQIGIQFSSEFLLFFHFFATLSKYFSCLINKIKLKKETQIKREQQAVNVGGVGDVWHATCCVCVCVSCVASDAQWFFCYKLVWINSNFKRTIFHIIFYI